MVIYNLLFTTTYFMTRIICSLFTMFGGDEGWFLRNIVRKRLQIKLKHTSYVRLHCKHLMSSCYIAYIN